MSDTSSRARFHQPTATATFDVPAFVVVVDGPDAGRSARLVGPAFVVGTGPNADLLLSDDTIAGEHLQFAPCREGISVRDLSGTHGTWMGTLRINDVVVAQPTAFVIGRTTLSLSFERPVSEIPPGASTSFGEAIGHSRSMRRLFGLLEAASRSDVSILIQGESGVGKDVLANAIHDRSPRARGPIVAIDCGAISPTLIESELFGHERGAFTGAERRRDGAFVQADGGTLFLDEVGELPLDLQPKLLRALETREIRPVGGGAPRSVDVRIIAATNRDLKASVCANEFRRDLYYRLAVMQFDVPPLRERKEDILPLARTFLQRLPGNENAVIPPEVEAQLLSHSWPGNVRELRNVISCYAVLGGNPVGMFGETAPQTSGESSEDLSHLPYREARAVAIARFERSYLPQVLARSGDVVVRAAAHAGVTRSSFHRMLQRIRSGDDSA